MSNILMKKESVSNDLMNLISLLMVLAVNSAES